MLGRFVCVLFLQHFKGILLRKIFREQIPLLQVYTVRAEFPYSVDLCWSTSCKACQTEVTCTRNSLVQIPATEMGKESEGAQKAVTLNACREEERTEKRLCVVLRKVQQGLCEPWGPSAPSGAYLGSQEWPSGNCRAPGRAQPEGKHSLSANGITHLRTESLEPLANYSPSSLKSEGYFLIITYKTLKM